MAVKRHKNGTRYFSELTFREGSDSIKQGLNNMWRMMERNIALSKDPIATRKKRASQIKGLWRRIIHGTPA